MTNSLSHNEMVETLWARSQIERLMTDLGGALDRKDWPLYRNCLSDTIDINFERTLNFPEIRTDSDTWTRLADHLLAPMRTHHTFSNYAIDLDGDKARATIYLVARHWRASDNGSSEFVQNGWYDNRFVRREGVWKLTRILHTHQWTSGNTAVLGTPTPEGAKLMKQVFCEANCITS